MAAALAAASSLFGTAVTSSSASPFHGSPVPTPAPSPNTVTFVKRSGEVRAGAYTRRSRGTHDPTASKKSWKQRHEKYMKPFILDVFISSKYVHAKVVHRLTSKVVSVATTNAKDLRYSLYSRTDDNACKLIGSLLAERSIDADVFAVTFNLRKGEKFEGRLALVVHTMVENGVALV